MSEIYKCLKFKAVYLVKTIFSYSYFRVWAGLIRAAFPE